jgi:hypothetical protein
MGMARTLGVELIRVIKNRIRPLSDDELATLFGASRSASPREFLADEQRGHTKDHEELIKQVRELLGDCGRTRRNPVPEEVPTTLVREFAGIY